MFLLSAGEQVWFGFPCNLSTPTQVVQLLWLSAAVNSGKEFCKGQSVLDVMMCMLICDKPETCILLMRGRLE